MAKPKHIPKTDLQAETQIARIGVLERDIAAEKVKRDAAVALIEAKLTGDTKTKLEERDQLVEGLRVWAEANRDRLTSGGKKKSAQLVTGKIAWAAGRASIEIAGDEAAVIAEIEKRIIRLTQKIAQTFDAGKTRTLTEEREALRGFLRLATSLNKTAMKDRPEVAQSLAGVQFVTGAETFDVKPLASQIAEVA